MNWIEISELARNVSLIFLGMIGAYVALQGLGSWKRQEEWKINREVASDVFESLLEYREAISRFRTRKVTSEEVRQYLSGEEVFECTMLEYFERLKPILEHRFGILEGKVRALQLSIERARFLWGNELGVEYNQVFFSVGMISNFLKTIYTSVPFMQPTLRSAILGQLEAEWGTVLEGKSGSDQFEEDLLKAVKAIEVDLRSRVGVLT
ncbi:hypothetical protein [uncultured Sulfitobacter sp.]|uniref:hypothetical protein n=1 Tax=uncultured Sulfitobacter sp. TaxID=191468 RepID=UPI00261F5B7C|nr:hypothetical protein [uncultured Sulfitobacter sp.]